MPDAAHYLRTLRDHQFAHAIFNAAEPGRPCTVTLVCTCGVSLTRPDPLDERASIPITLDMVAEHQGYVLAADAHVRESEDDAVHHGVTLWADEDGWHWTLLGHHEPRRVVAAIAADARSGQYYEDFVDVGPGRIRADLEANIVRRWLDVSDPNPAVWHYTPEPVGASVIPITTVSV